jgi:hypothetical protein
MMDYVAVVRVRAKISQLDKHFGDYQIPFSTNTTTLIDSILKPMKRENQK